MSQIICDKFNGKVVHEVGPKDRIHPSIIDIVDYMAGDDLAWKHHPQLKQWRQAKQINAQKNKKSILMADKDRLQSYLKSMKNRARRAKYASTRP
tara:strand:+ start:306 stop:590 length:285 start_codon:yes stop_codon:yes gene_type:complete